MTTASKQAVGAKTLATLIDGHSSPSTAGSLGPCALIKVYGRLVAEVY